MGRIYKTKVYVHPDAPRTFRTEHDLRGWCLDNGKDPTFIMGFDSTSEYNRWLQLLDMQRRGEISDLRRQVEYELIPRQTHIEQVGAKLVKVYSVPFYDTVRTFRTKAEASAFCRDNMLPRSSISMEEHSIPRLREVTDEKPAIYTADFVYRRADGTEVVEDCKSEFTRREKDYVLRRKFLRWRWGIKIYEHVVK
jgi:hypothetical protein